MKRMLRDLQYAFINLLRSPLLAGLALLSLALGIGANTAIFSIINAVLLRPLPYPGPDRLVHVWETYIHSTGRGAGPVSTPNLVDWREQSASFERLAAYSPASFNLTGSDRPVVVKGALLEPKMWGLLGVEALHGRVFEDPAQKENVVVLSFRLWQRLYSSDPRIIGEKIGIDGISHTIIGIMPASFRCPPRSDVELWTPLAYTPQQINARGSHWLLVLGRLRSEVTLAEAQAEMNGIAARLEAAYPGSQSGRGVRIQPLRESLVWQTEDALWTLWAAVGFVLLIACANVANLLLARSASRCRELAVRAALGAGDGRIIWHALSESLVLALAGGVAGLLLGHSAVGFLASLPGSSIPQGQLLHLDSWVLAFCLGVSMLTAIVTGILPALRSVQVNLVEALNERSQSQRGAGRRDWLRAGLVVGEVALAVVVLMGAGLLLKSYTTLLQAETGIESQGLLTLSIPLAGPNYQDGGQVTTFYHRLQQRVERLPGVESTGVIDLLPLARWGSNAAIYHEGLDPDTPLSQLAQVELRSIGGDYFEAMGVSLVEGRLFGSGGRSAREVIVNEAFVDRVFNGQSPLGRGVGSPTYLNTIVGVVDNVRSAGLHTPPLPEMYYPLEARPRWTMTLVVRASGDPLSLAEPVRRSVQEIDPELPIFSVSSMDQVLARSVADKRFSTLLMGVFASVAVALAMAGVYGVLAYGVKRRAYEIAVRMALGATRTDIYKLVVKASLLTAGPGIAVGALLSLWFTHYMEGQLHGVEATDATTMAVACSLLLAVSLATALVPARNAGCVNPLQMLRSQ